MCHIILKGNRSAMLSLMMLSCESVGPCTCIPWQMQESKNNCWASFISIPFPKMRAISPSLESFKSNSSVSIEWHTAYVESSLGNKRIKDRVLAWPAAFPVGLTSKEHWAAGVQFCSPSAAVVAPDPLASVPAAPHCASHPLHSLGLSEHPLQGISTGFTDPGEVHVPVLRVQQHSI